MNSTETAASVPLRLLFGFLEQAIPETSSRQKRGKARGNRRSALQDKTPKIVGGKANYWPLQHLDLGGWLVRHSQGKASRYYLTDKAHSALKRMKPIVWDEGAGHYDH